MTAYQRLNNPTSSATVATVALATGAVIRGRLEVEALCGEGAAPKLVRRGVGVQLAGRGQRGQLVRTDVICERPPPDGDVEALVGGFLNRYKS
jgi:hypothetical protein